MDQFLVVMLMKNGLLDTYMTREHFYLVLLIRQNGFDLCIKTLSNEAERSYSNLGLTYGKGQFNHNSQTFLTGSYQFKTKEIEVFSFEDKY